MQERAEMVTDRLIPVYGKDGVRAYALVDARDVAYVQRFRWSMVKGGYAVRYASRAPGDRRGRGIVMHRELLGLERGDPRQVDHINRNPLDRRRTNMRIVTAAQNKQNVSPGGQRGRGSDVRGVVWDKDRQLWAASVGVNKRKHHLGRFRDKDEAARAVKAFRREHLPFSQCDVERAG